MLSFSINSVLKHLSSEILMMNLDWLSHLEEKIYENYLVF